MEDTAAQERSDAMPSQAPPLAGDMVPRAAPPTTTETSGDARVLGRELVRVLGQAQSIAERIAALTGHVLPGEIQGTVLAESLGESASRIRREFLGESA